MRFTRQLSHATRISSVLFVLGLSLARIANAQDRDTTKLNTVIISASKTPVARSQLTQSVTVISGDDLRARGVSRVSDALLAVPGVSIAQNGSVGSVTSLFLRGGESRYTKVLIDGVAVNQSGGYFDFSHLTTDNIGRIEIVRGPASVLYGADAVTGVIQIFTRKGSGPLSIDASGRGGTYDTKESDLSFSGSKSAVSYSLGGGQHLTDGLFKFNNEYSNGTLSASLGVSPSAKTDVRITTRYTDAEFHYPTDYTGAPVDSNSYRVQHRLTVGADAGVNITPSVRARFLAGTNEVSDLSEDIAVPFGDSTQLHSADRSRAHRRTAEARLGFVSPRAANLNVGVEYVSEEEKSSSVSGPVGLRPSPVSQFDATRNTKAVYAELLGLPERRVAYTASIRLDDNSDYGSHTTYRIGASVPVLSDIRVRASLSSAFNAPAFDQIRPTLYSFGNPALAPERARSWEAGVEEFLDDGYGRVSVTYFNQLFEDLIQYAPGGPPSFKGSFANLEQARSNGYETELDFTPPGNLTGSASYTVATPRVARLSSSYSGDLRAGEALLRRPTHSGAASLSFAPPGETIGLTATYVGKRPDIDFNEFPSPTVTLPAYWRVDLSSSVDVWRNSRGSRVSVTARAENALDKRYETVLHFLAPGRVILVGARFSGSL